MAPDDVLQRIGALLDGSDLAGAREAVQAALQQYPDDPAVHNFAGVVSAQTGDVSGAEHQFRTAMRLAPSQPAPYENLGRLYQEHAADIPDARDKALAVYRQLLRVDPASVEGLYQAGFLLALGGEFAESRTLLDRLPPDVRQQSQTLAVLAVVLAGLGDAKGAGATVSTLAGHPDLTATDVAAVAPAFVHLKDAAVEIRLLEALDTRGLSTPGSLQQLGQLYTAHGNPARARQVLERAAAATPGGAGVPLLVDLARAADKTGDHKGALGYLAHARVLEPDNATVHFMFGLVCVEMDLVREAIESMRKAVTLAPDNPSVNYVMGAVAMHGHEPADSLPYFEKYVALEPGDPRGRLALGAARYYSNQLDAARPDLQAATGHAETAPAAHYFLGRIARQLNDLDTARQEVTTAVQLDPKIADAWAELGLIDTRKGDYRTAQEDLDRAVAIDPDNYAAAVNLALLYARTKDPRREAQAARLAALQKTRAERAQEFLRIIKVEP